MQWAFRTAGLHRVGLSVVGWNERVVKLYQSIGFVIEGRIKERFFWEGQWWDEIVMGILAEDWRNKLQTPKLIGAQSEKTG